MPPKPQGETGHWKTLEKKLKDNVKKLEEEKKSLQADVDRLSKVCRDRDDLEKVNLEIAVDVINKLTTIKQVD